MTIELIETENLLLVANQKNARLLRLKNREIEVKNHTLFQLRQVFFLSLSVFLFCSCLFCSLF